MILKVIGNGQSVETETISGGGRPYLLRILPYRTAEGKTDGAVITLVELSPRSIAHSRAEGLP